MNIGVRVSVQQFHKKILLLAFRLVWPMSCLRRLCLHAWMFPWQSWTSHPAAVWPSSLKKTARLFAACASHALGSSPEPAKHNPRNGNNISWWITGKLAAHSVSCRLFLIQLLLSGNIAASLLAPAARCDRSLRAVSKKGEQLSSVGQRLPPPPPPSLRLFTLHIFAAVAPDPLLFFISSLYTKKMFHMCQRWQTCSLCFETFFLFLCRSLMTFPDSSFSPTKFGADWGLLSSRQNNQS